jgi:hypothetical protein
MLSKIVTEYLEARLPGIIERVEPKEGYFPFLRIRSKSPSFGDIELHSDGEEVTIFYGRFTHSHYGNYEDIPKEDKERRIAEDVFEALDDTFNDRYEFWGGHDGMGGFQDVEYADRKKQGIITRLFGKPSRTFYRWSGATRTIKS